MNLVWRLMHSSLSQVCTLLVQIFMMISCNYGFGKHIASLSVSDKLAALKVRVQPLTPSQKLMELQCLHHVFNSGSTWHKSSTS
jgi:hypothetical protein